VTLHISPRVSAYCIRARPRSTKSSISRWWRPERHTWGWRERGPGGRGARMTNSKAGKTVAHVDFAQQSTTLSNMTQIPLSLVVPPPPLSHSRTPDRKGTKSRDGGIAARRHSRERRDIGPQRRILLAHRHLCDVVVSVCAVCAWGFTRVRVSKPLAP
jgi:hypothetical protein